MTAAFALLSNALIARCSPSLVHSRASNHSTQRCSDTVSTVLVLTPHKYEELHLTAGAIETEGPLISHNLPDKSSLACCRVSCPNENTQIIVIIERGVHM